MSGPAEAQEAVEVFRQRLKAVEVAEMNLLVDSYRPVQENVDKSVARVTSLAQKRKLKPWEVMRLTAMTNLKTAVVGDIALYASIVQTHIAQGQAAAVALAQQSAVTVTAAGLPPGITPDMLSRLGIQWNALPREAFANFVGIAADGRPVGAMLAELGPQSAEAIKQTVGRGIATGLSPRETARAVEKVSGMNLSRAMSIARSETNRSYREASRLQFAANPNVVKGYRRLATKDESTCMACIALDNTVYETNEPLDSHPNCRCTMVPDTLTYQDLGLDIPEPPRPENGQEWFAKQSGETQKNMMGTKTFAAYQDGRVGLNDLVTTTTDRVWGKSSTVKSAKALGL